MIRDLRDSKSNRRKFLRDLAAAGGLAAVAAGTAGAATAGAIERKQPEAKPRRGYRVTAHVSKYYDKARF